MDHMLYIAMSGAKQNMLAQAVNTNNLANVSTTAFREDLASFQSQAVEGAGYPTRVNAVAKQNGVNFDAGSIMSTGRELDVAIQGEGWIAVQSADGSEGYTRAGNFRITPAGLLTTANGNAVLGNNGGPIAIPPAEKIDIGADGTISIRPAGQTPAALVTVDRIKLVNPEIENMQKGADGLIRLKDSATAEPDAGVRLISGSLETSNVNAVEAMVNMIELARQFEMEIKLMKVAEDNDAASTKLLSLT